MSPNAPLNSCNPMLDCDQLNLPAALLSLYMLMG
jgi:hypothetical protein